MLAQASGRATSCASHRVIGHCSTLQSSAPRLGARHLLASSRYVRVGAGVAELRLVEGILVGAIGWNGLGVTGAASGHTQPTEWGSSL